MKPIIEILMYISAQPSKRDRSHLLGSCAIVCKYSIALALICNGPLSRSGGHSHTGVRTRFAAGGGGGPRNIVPDRERGHTSLSARSGSSRGRWLWTHLLHYKNTIKQQLLDIESSRELTLHRSVTAISLQNWIALTQSERFNSKTDRWLVVIRSGLTFSRWMRFTGLGLSNSKHILDIFITDIFTAKDSFTVQSLLLGTYGIYDHVLGPTQRCVREREKGLTGKPSLSSEIFETPSVGWARTPLGQCSPANFDDF